MENSKEHEIEFLQAKNWEQDLQELHTRIGPRFKRAEPRQRVLKFLKGLISPLQRKNGWQLAEYAGETRPDGMQRLLKTAHWDANLVRDDLFEYVVTYLGDEAAIIVLDETGFLKKGLKSAGVKRQYSGTAGRIENCQVGVFAAYVGVEGSRTLLDRQLYLPKEWLEEPERCKQAGITQDIQFATKPGLAQAMLQRIKAAEVPFKWVTGDSVYGGDRNLRMWLEEQGHSFVLAVAQNEPLFYDFQVGKGPQATKACAIVASLTEAVWQRLSCGEGAKGPRLYDWACVPLFRLGWPNHSHRLLVRRSISNPTELTCYVVFCSNQTSLAELIKVAGQRWCVEECFEIAKDNFGLDHYEVRSLTGWYRHVTLVMLAQAFVNVLRLRALFQSEPEPTKQANPWPSTVEELLPLTLPEIRHLLWALVFSRPLSKKQIVHWSNWRRRHQARAKRSHYKRHLALSGV